MPRGEGRQGRAFFFLLILVGCSPLIEGGTTHLPVTFIRLVLIVLLCAWLLASLKQGLLEFHRTELDLPLLLFVFLAIVTTVTSPYFHMSAQWLGSILSYAAFFFLLIQLVDSHSRIRSALYTVIAVGFLESVVGCAQWLFFGFERATGTFFNPNFLASYLVAVSALLLGLVITPGSLRRGEKVVGMSVCVLMVLTIILTGSRGGWLALIPAIGWVVWFRFGKVAVMVMFASALCLVVIPNPIHTRIISEHQHNPYTYSRLEIWKSSVQRAMDHPAGVGLGIYKYTSQQYPTPIEGVVARYGTRAQTAHNEYLHMTVELGLAGLVVFLWGTACMGRAFYGSLAVSSSAEERGMLSGLAGGMLGILSHAVVDSTFHAPAIVLLLILFGGLGLAVRRLSRHRDWKMTYSMSATRFAVVGLCVIALLMSVLTVRPALAWYALLDSQQSMREGNVEGSLARLDWVEILAPGNATYQDAIAFAALHQYRLSGEMAWAQKAIAAATQAAALNPLEGRYPSHRGLIYKAVAQRVSDGKTTRWALEEARTSFKDAIERDPYSPLNYVEHAKILVALGEPHAARTGLLHAVALEPNYLPARQGLARLYQQIGQPQRAIEEYREILRRKAEFGQGRLTPLEQRFLNVDAEQVHVALAALTKP